MPSAEAPTGPSCNSSEFQSLSQSLEFDGEARKITNDLNGYTSISLTADSSALVTIQENKAMDIWVAPDGDAVRATKFKSVSSNMDGLDTRSPQI